MIDQQPYFHKYKEQSFAQSSFNQYLPKQTFHSSTQNTISYQNFTMMLKYCSRLEKEVEGLKEKLMEQMECNKELIAKTQRHTHTFTNTNNSSSLLNSFHLVNRSHSRKNSPRQCPLQRNDLALHFQREMIVMLKQQNAVLNEKIKKLYQQNQQLLSNKIGRNDKNELDTSLPFKRINLKENESYKMIKMKGNNTMHHLPPQQLNQKINLLHRKLINSNQGLSTFDLK